MNGLNAFGQTIGGVFQSVIGLVKRTDDSRRIFQGLISTWRSNLLWLIDRVFLKLAKDGYAGNAIVYAVLTTLIRAVAEPPMIAYTEDEDGVRTKLPSAHDLCRLIDKPTPGLLSQYEAWELVTLYIGHTGRYTAFIERANSGQPIGLWPLRPDRVGPIYSTLEDTEARVLKGWSYQVPGTGRFVAIPREDVFLINFPDPSGESGGLVEGLGPMQALTAEISSDNEATRMVGDLIANNATPSLAIMTKTPISNKETADLVKYGWMQQLGGSHRGEPAVLDAGTTIQTIGFTLSQLEFPNLRGITESRVSAAFGVPAVLAGLKTGIDRAADANLDGLRLYFTETTCASYWRRYEDAFTNQVAVWWGPNVVCAFDRRQVRALSTQTRQEKQPMADGFALGAVTVDEYREHVLNLDPLPKGAGQVFMVPSGFIPTRDLGVMADAPDPVPPAEGSGMGSIPSPQAKAIHLNGHVAEPVTV